MSQMGNEWWTLAQVILPRLLVHIQWEAEVFSDVVTYRLGWASSRYNFRPFLECSLMPPATQLFLPLSIYSSDFYHVHYSACALWCLVSFIHWTLCLWDSFIFESSVVFRLFSLLHCILCVCVSYMIYSFILLLINIWIVGSLLLAWTMLLWMFANTKSLFFFF